MEGGLKNTLANCDRAEALFRDRCTGATWELDTVRIFSLWCLTYMGELAELTRRRQVLLTDAQERGDLYAITYLSTYIMAIVQLGGRRPGGGPRASYARPMGRWSQKGFHVQHHNALLARVYIDLYSGDGRRGLASHLGEVAGVCVLVAAPAVQQVRIDVAPAPRPKRPGGGLASPDPRPLIRSAERDARRLERERVPWAQAHAAYVRAALAQARGDTPRARAGLARARSLYDPADPLAAAARRRLGAHRSAARRAKALVAEADAWMAAQSIRNPARMAAMYAPGDFPG